MGTVAGWIGVAGLVALIVWGVGRYKRGVASINALVARVEAHAAAESFAAAVASNRTVVRIGSGGDDNDDDGADDDYQRALAAAYRAGAADASRVGLLAGGTGIRPGAGGVVAGAALRDQGGQVT